MLFLTQVFGVTGVMRTGHRRERRTSEKKNDHIMDKRK